MIVYAQEPTKELIEGEWIGISHQTITVFSCRSNGTFSGTYFTPSMDIRATFSGEWTLEKDTLTFNYIEADSPPFRVPMEDKNRIEIVSNDSLILHTLPQGISVTWNRVNYADHWSKKAQRKEYTPPPTLSELASLSTNDLIDSNVLMNWISFLIDSSEKNLFDDKMVDALRNKIPTKAGYYFAVFQFEGLWSNGGMQHVLLREELEQTQYLLKVTASGYDYFGKSKSASLVRELAKKTKVWMSTLMAMNENTPDEKYEVIWQEVDHYDDVFDKLNEKESDWYEALLKDIHTNPEDYTTIEKKD